MRNFTVIFFEKFIFTSMPQILFGYLLFHARFCSCIYLRHRLSAMFMAGKDPFPFCKLPLHTNDCVLVLQFIFHFMKSYLSILVLILTLPVSCLERHFLCLKVKLYFLLSLLSDLGYQVLC